MGRYFRVVRGPFDGTDAGRPKPGMQKSLQLASKHAGFKKYIK
jgi:hypothetical protein